MVIIVIRQSSCLLVFNSTQIKVLNILCIYLYYTLLHFNKFLTTNHQFYRSIRVHIL